MRDVLRERGRSPTATSRWRAARGSTAIAAARTAPIALHYLWRIGEAMITPPRAVRAGLCRRLEAVAPPAPARRGVATPRRTSSCCASRSRSRACRADRGRTRRSCATGRRPSRVAWRERAVADGDAHRGARRGLARSALGARRRTRRRCARSSAGASRGLDAAGDDDDRGGDVPRAARPGQRPWSRQAAVRLRLHRGRSTRRREAQVRLLRPAGPVGRPAGRALRRPARPARPTLAILGLWLEDRRRCSKTRISSRRSRWVSSGCDRSSARSTSMRALCNSESSNGGFLRYEAETRLRNRRQPGTRRPAATMARAAEVRHYRSTTFVQPDHRHDRRRRGDRAHRSLPALAARRPARGHVESRRFGERGVERVGAARRRARHPARKPRHLARRPVRSARERGGLRGGAAESASGGVVTEERGRGPPHPCRSARLVPRDSAAPEARRAPRRRRRRPRAAAARRPSRAGGPRTASSRWWPAIRSSSSSAASIREAGRRPVDHRELRPPG